MEEERKKLPVGIEHFKKIRTEGFYYVDKTEMIRDLLTSWGEVNLFTRPRRFGKTLNMDMLQAFLEIGADASLFDGLNIAREADLCEKYLGQFPVISISLKSVTGSSFEEALENLSGVIQEEARRLQFLLTSEKLTMIDKRALSVLYEDEISAKNLKRSLKLLSEMLFKHYEKKVIILIDEYDVPLDKAYTNGYYDEMAGHIRSTFELALKTNRNLYFAVITGCLRISKESIFTGLNNFNVHTIAETEYDEYFGFTDEEVKEMLAYYHLNELYDTVKEWYDGYRFGKANIYCPWDVISYIKAHVADIEAPPEMYWLNTSENAIVRQLIHRADAMMKYEIEQLIAGESITKEVKKELTYKDLDRPDEGKADNSKENLWSVLFTTGYLTLAESPSDSKHYKLTIPNKEIQNIFVTQVQGWMQDTVITGDRDRLHRFCEAVKCGDGKSVQEMLNTYLEDTISIRDTSVRKDRKENFYHGMLLGILKGEGSWIVKSNAESGIGYSDILVEVVPEKIGCVIEIKYAEEESFDAACMEAMRQICDRDYAAVLRKDGMRTIHAYGVACFKKSCQVVYKKLPVS